MKKFLFAASLFSLSHAVTFIGAGGVGEEIEQYNTARRSMGGAGMAMVDQGSFSFHNPARMAFGEKTSFGATLSGESLKAEKGSVILNDNAFHFPAFNLVFSATEFAFALSYLQTYQNDVRIKNGDGEKVYESLGGLSEFVFSGSYQFFNQLGLGASYHLVSGKDRRYFGFQSNPDFWRQGSDYSQYEPYMEQQIVNEGGYPSFSIHWEDRRFALSAGIKLPYEIERKVSRQTYLAYNSKWASGIADPSELDVYTVEPSESQSVQKMPMQLSFGSKYHLTRLNVLVLDVILADASGDEFQFKSWTGLLDESSIEHQTRWSLALGYQWGASLKPFDSYMKRLALRSGFGLKQIYQGDALEWRGTAGIGLPLGKRGATLDIGGHYGNRISADGSQFDEQFAGFSLTFTGFGNWGQPSRRYR